MRRFTYGLFLAGALATTGCDQTTVSPAGPLVTGQHGITAIAADGSFVYWSTDQGAVMRVSIDGGQPETVVPAQPEFVPSDNAQAALKVDAQSVYWTTNAAVMSAPKVGGTPVLLAGGEMAPLSDLTGVTVDDASEFVYFTHGSGFVRKAPKIPGAMVTLASAEDSPRTPVVRGASLYWAAGVAEQGGTARALDVAGGSPTDVLGSSVSDSASSFAGISADDHNVYWTAGGAVSWVSIAGGTASVIQSGDFVISALLGDDTDVYWASPSGDVNMAPVTPHVSAQPVATGPVGPVYLAVDTTSFYWASQTAGTVIMTPKLALTSAVGVD